MPSKLKQQRQDIEVRLRDDFTGLYKEWLKGEGAKPSDDAIRAFAREMVGVGGLTEDQIYTLVKF